MILDEKNRKFSNVQKCIRIDRGWFWCMFVVILVRFLVSGDAFARLFVIPGLPGLSWMYAGTRDEGGVLHRGDAGASHKASSTVALSVDR